MLIFAGIVIFLLIVGLIICVLNGNKLKEEKKDLEMEKKILRTVIRNANDKNIPPKDLV